MGINVNDLNHVCYRCGSYTKNGHMKSVVSSWWVDTCPICNRVVPVTQVRDYGYFTQDEVIRMEAYAKVMADE